MLLPVTKIAQFKEMNQLLWISDRFILTKAGKDGGVSDSIETPPSNFANNLREPSEHP